MTFEGLGEMIEGYSADTGAGKFPLASMGVLAEGLACADPGARTPIGASGNYQIISFPFEAVVMSKAMYKYILLSHLTTTESSTAVGLL